LTVEWTRNAVQATGSDKVVAAGGAFLNVKANKLIREMPEVKSLYVYPAADDGGASIGAGILGHLQLCREAGRNVPLELPRHLYLGLSFDDADCERAVQGRGLRCRKMSDPAAEVAALLAAGHVVARFAGGEEAGPRALGNRSILADPRDLRMIRKLNFAIKQRDFWMPFAGSVRVEAAPRYIRNLSAWPFYMIEAFDTTAAGLRDLCAAVHPFDETIRPQVVTPDLNPEYHALLGAFERLTGVGGLLNTSFNLHGSPIVGTPTIALDTLERSALDAVALGSLLVTKVELPTQT
jgi:carbamoyltransferase